MKACETSAGRDFHVTAIVLAKSPYVSLKLWHQSPCSGQKDLIRHINQINKAKIVIRISISKY